MPDPSLVGGKPPTLAIGQYGLVDLLKDYRPSLGPNGPQIVKKYWVNGPEAFAIANAIMGITNSTVVAGPINRRAPHRCPESMNIFAQSVEVEFDEESAPILGPPGRPMWEDAVLTVAYGPWAPGSNASDNLNMMTPDGQSYPFCTFSIDYGSDFIVIPETGMRYSEGSAGPTGTDPGFVGPPSPGRRMGQNVGLRVGTMNLNVRIHKVPYLGDKRLSSLQGKTNSTTFLGYPPGEILFDGGKTTQNVDTNGVSTNEVDLTFKWRSKPWGTVPDPNDATTFVRITHDGTPTGRGLYERGNLTALMFGVSFNLDGNPTGPDGEVLDPNGEPYASGEAPSSFFQ